MANLLPKSLMKKPKTFEEFQDFYFYWDATEMRGYGSVLNRNEITEGSVKELKLILWNARKTRKDKNLTESEVARIFKLYNGDDEFTIYDEEGYSLKIVKHKGWKDSDNPKCRDRYNKNNGLGKWSD